MNEDQSNEKIQKNNREEIVQTIQYHIKNNMLITIERSSIFDNNTAEGFPILISDTLMLMTLVVDFHDEGFLIMRIEEIIDAYSKESDAFYEEICVKEGLREKTLETPISSIVDIFSVLKQLTVYDRFISIQCEFEDDELIYSIGKILNIEKDMVHFKNINKMGKWDDITRVIPLDKITLISIADYYTNLFYKYAKI